MCRGLPSYIRAAGEGISEDVTPRVCSGSQGAGEGGGGHLVQWELLVQRPWGENEVGWMG